MLYQPGTISSIMWSNSMIEILGYFIASRRRRFHGIKPTARTKIIKNSCLLPWNRQKGTVMGKGCPFWRRVRWQTRRHTQPWPCQGCGISKDWSKIWLQLHWIQVYAQFSQSSNNVRPFEEYSEQNEPMSIRLLPLQSTLFLSMLLS